MISATYCVLSFLILTSNLKRLELFNWYYLADQEKGKSNNIINDWWMLTLVTVAIVESTSQNLEWAL